MPHRPDSHIVSDKALHSVMDICIQCGWACEPVHKDYGEDILVQTSYNGIVDHSRIWIQVKGTRNLNKHYSKKYGYSMKVSLDHALKWVRSADLVVVVLWDVEKNYGLWSLPKDCVNEWDWYLLKTEKSRLIFSENSLFDLENALKIGWIARFNHYMSLILNARDRDLAHLRYSVRSNNPNIDYKNRAPLIAYDFVRLIQVFDGEFFDQDFLTYYQNAAFNYRRKDPLLSKAEVQGMAAMIAILRKSEETTKKASGFPETLLVECFEVVMSILRSMEYSHLKQDQSDESSS